MERHGHRIFMKNTTVDAGKCSGSCCPGPTPWSYEHVRQRVTGIPSWRWERDFKAVQTLRMPRLWSKKETSIAVILTICRIGICYRKCNEKRFLPLSVPFLWLWFVSARQMTDVDSQRTHLHILRTAASVRECDLPFSGTSVVYYRICRCTQVRALVNEERTK
jgi:hypothetical protein